MRLAQILGGLAAVLLFPNQVLAAEPLPQRWVSAGGALSEWVVELGGEAHLVGVDTTSLHPASLSRLPSIGYQRQLAAEGILSLQPQLLLGTEEMGPPPVLAQLKAAGVQVEVLPSTPDLSTLAANLQLDAVCYNAFIQEQSLGIHYNQANDLMDYVSNPEVFAYKDGMVAIPTGPGLGIEVNEDYVRERAQEGHRWRNPVWRHRDGSFAEW